MVAFMDPKKHDTILSSVQIPAWAEQSTQHLQITADQLHTPTKNRHRHSWLTLASNACTSSCSCMPLLPHCSRHTCSIRSPLTRSGKMVLPADYMNRGFLRLTSLLLRTSSSPLLLPPDTPSSRPCPASCPPLLGCLPRCCGCCCALPRCSPSDAPLSLLSPSRLYLLAWARCFRKAACAARCCICLWISCWKLLACAVRQHGAANQAGASRNNISCCYHLLACLCGMMHREGLVFKAG